ncbi:MAG: hypothetical protein WBV06_11410, partial [Acidimicrobiia bacterium]
NRDSVDGFDLTGNDLYRVAIEFSDLFNYLEGHPTGTAEQMAGLMYEPDYPYWDKIVANFEELTSHPGWHYADAGIRTLGIEVLELSDTTARVVYVEDRDVQLIRDADDVVVREYLGWDPELTTYILRRGDDGQWRIVDLEPTRPATDEDIASLVPVDWTGRRL